MKSDSKTVSQSPFPLLTGVAAGLIAGAVTGQTDQFLDRFVSKKQKKRDRKVREASAHQMAGPHFGQKITGRKLSKQDKQRATMAFNVFYGVMWGLIYAGVRKKAPTLARWGGIPFGIPFFFACDGLLAPLLGVSPNLRRIPWQPSAKEMGNHIAWTASAEMVHRGAARAASAIRENRKAS